MLTDRIASTMQKYVGDAAAPASLAAAALAGGRRRVRRRRIGQAAGAAGLAAAGVVGAGVAVAGGGRRSQPAAITPAASTPVPTTPTPTTPTAATSVQTASATAAPVVDGVTVTYLPPGWRPAAAPATTSGSDLPCLTDTRVVYTPPGGGSSSLSIDVRRGPISFPDPDGGPSFGPTDLGRIVDSPYHGPGATVGTLAAGTYVLGQELTVTVGGRDLDEPTVRRVLDGLQAGPAPTERSVTPMPAPTLDPAVHAAHC